MFLTASLNAKKAAKAEIEAINAARASKAAEEAAMREQKMSCRDKERGSRSLRNLERSVAIREVLDKFEVKTPNKERIERREVERKAKIGDRILQMKKAVSKARRNSIEAQKKPIEEGEQAGAELCQAQDKFS